MSNPFDFSDFDFARAPLGTATPRLEGAAAAMGPDTLVHNEFDPFSVALAGQVQPPKTVAQNAPLSAPEFEVARPPLALLGLALALAAAGIVTSLLFGRALSAAGTGWLLAGPLAIGALSAYSRVDTRRRADGAYSAPGWTGAAYWAVVVMCLAGIGLGAWYLALWAGGQ